MTDLLLPPGTHPHDASQPLDRHSGAPVPLDAPHGPVPRARKPWGTVNSQALPVFQRLAAESNVTTFLIGTTPQKIISRTPGRTKLSIWVPTHYVDATGTLQTNGNGVLVSEDEGVLTQFLGGVWLDTSTSMDWFSETSLWAVAVASHTPGVLAMAHHWNPAGSDRGPDY